MGWEQAFEEYLKPFGDLHGNKWQDNPVDAVFRGGYELGLKAQHEASFRAGIEAASNYCGDRADDFLKTDGEHNLEIANTYANASFYIQRIPTPPLTKESE